MRMQQLKDLPHLHKMLLQFGYGLRIIWRLFNERGVWAHASVCGYATILSLVPILAISLSIITAFTTHESVSLGGEEGIQQEVFSNKVFDFVFDHFIPGAADTQHEEVLMAKREIMKFVENTKSLRFVIFILLIIASVSLFNSIEHAFNEIWSVRHRRHLFARFLAFWILLTITPLLLALSYYYTTAFASTQAYERLIAISWGSSIYNHGISYILTLFAFLIANRYLPNLHVSLVPALVGSASSAILWESAKVVFDYYINYALTTEGYYSVFGTLAAIPLFICWLYYGYLCFLLGPVIACTIQDFERHRIRMKRKASWPSHWPIQSIYVFLDICRNFRDQQKGITYHELEDAEGISFVHLRRCLYELEQAGLIHQDRQKKMYYPSGDPAQLPLNHVLARLIGLQPKMKTTFHASDGRLANAIQEILHTDSDIPIATFLEEQN